jgi:hypothetical protein
MLYRCVEIDPAGRPGDAIVFNALDDVVAIVRSSSIAVSWFDFELWCEERLVVRRRSDIDRDA